MCSNMLAITHSSIFLQWQTPIRFSKEVLQKSSVVLVCFVLGLRLLEHTLALNCWKISSSGLDYWNIELDGMQTWFLGNKLYYLFPFSFSPIFIYIFSCVMFHCFITYVIFIWLLLQFSLHFPLSGPVLTYISLLIIPCMIVYVTNNKEPWTNLEPSRPHQADESHLTWEL